MNIHEALKNVVWDKQEYFKWKFPDIRFDQTKAPRTGQEFLDYVGKKTMNAYLKWERSAEYKALVALYLQSKTANDLQEIYEEVSQKAKTGDEKAVKLFLQLNKEVAEHAKQALKVLGEGETQEEEDDELIV